MNSRLHPSVYMLVGFFLCAAAGANDAYAADSPGIVLGGDVILNSTRDCVMALAGGIVITEGNLGDAAMAAGTVHMVGGKISRLAVSGGTVAFDGGDLGDVLAAAGILKVNTHVNGDLRAVGGSIVTTRDTVIGGDVHLSGDDVAIDGTIKNGLSVRAEHIAIAGTIGGTVYATGADIVVAPGTHIGGDMIYSAPGELALPPDVTVGGKVVRRGYATPAVAPHSELLRYVSHLVWSVGFFGLLICGFIIVAAWPSLVDFADNAFAHRFGTSLLTGLVAACALPVASAVLTVTLIGIPLALLLLAAGVTFAGIGLVVACRWAGDRVRIRFGRPPPLSGAHEAGWGLAGFGMFVVVGLVPILGAMAQFTAIVAGAGAILTALWNRWLMRTGLII